MFYFFSVDSYVELTLINHSFHHIGNALQLLKSNPESDKFKEFYDALSATINAFEKAHNSIAEVKVGNIDRILDALRRDDVFRDGVDKNDIITRLESIKQSILSSK